MRNSKVKTKPISTTRKPAPDAECGPTPAETELVKDWTTASKGRVRPLRMRVEQKATGETGLKTDHPAGESVWAALLMRSMGTHNEHAASWLLNILINGAVSGGGTKPLSETELNGTVAMLQETAPKDEIESMLIGQMIVTHSLVAIQARRLRGAENIPQLDANGTLLTKLQRTFVAQVEALQRYRSKGQQQVRVEHVHVHEGGRAIVGTIRAGGGVRTKIEDQPHAPALTHDPGNALPSEIKTVREAVPVACR